MCRGSTHSDTDEDGHSTGSGRRCRCCDPAARRGARREARLRSRGHRGEVGEDYASGTVAARALMAKDRPEGTYDPSPTVRAARARRGSLTPEEEEVLAGDERPTVRAALAANPATGSETLDLLAGDPDRSVREAVARHPDTRPEALATMAATLDRRRDIAVAQAIARHPNTPAAALDEWIASGTSGQRSIAQHALAARVAGAVLDGTEHLGERLEEATAASSESVDDLLGVEPTRSTGGARRAATVG